jgi:Glyoxalase-like domain
MDLRMEYLAVTCDSPDTVSAFWQAVLGGSRTPTVDGLLLQPPASGNVPAILFASRTEGIAPRGRPALRLGSVEGTLKEHVARLTELGATIVFDEPRGGLGHVGLGEVIMEDPEGNQFAVQSSDRETELVTRALEEEGEIDLSGSYFAGRTSDPPPYTTVQARIPADHETYPPSDT